ncbi:hypothetical protein COO60DRAFT_1644283 [Scenedesmus sp. NREL 46B-D3]|nr:hypothetical protein COO60DRAFT_1644283 [Scenedesmus sp. NREL 46B-D3]
MAAAIGPVWLSPLGLAEDRGRLGLPLLSGLQQQQQQQHLIILDTISYRPLSHYVAAIPEPEAQSILCSLKARMQGFKDSINVSVHGDCMARLSQIFEQEGFQAQNLRLALKASTMQYLFTMSRSACSQVEQQAEAAIKRLDAAAAASRKDMLLDGLQQVYQQQMYSSVQTLVMSHLVGLMCCPLLEVARDLHGQPAAQHSTTYERHTRLAHAMLKCLFQLPRTVVVQLPPFWCWRLQGDPALRAECAASHASMLQASAHSHLLAMMSRFDIDHALARDLGKGSVVLCNPAKELMRTCNVAVMTCFAGAKWHAFPGPALPVSGSSDDRSQQQQQHVLLSAIAILMTKPTAYEYAA